MKVVISLKGFEIFGARPLKRSYGAFPLYEFSTNKVSKSRGLGRGHSQIRVTGLLLIPFVSS